MNRKPLQKLLFVVVVLGSLSMVVRSVQANTGVPSECAQTALAAWKAAQLENPESYSHYERNFIEISRYLRARARGDKAQFLEWYRDACIVKRVPRNVRVEGNRVLLGARA